MISLVNVNSFVFVKAGISTPYLNLHRVLSHNFRGIQIKHSELWESKQNYFWAVRLMIL